MVQQATILCQVETQPPHAFEMKEITPCWANSNEKLYSDIMLLFIVAPGLCSSFQACRSFNEHFKVIYNDNTGLKFFLDDIGIVISSSSQAVRLISGFNLRYITSIHFLKFRDTVEL